MVQPIRAQATRPPKMALSPWQGAGALLIATAFLASGAFAATPADNAVGGSVTDLQGVIPMSDQELAGLRGGFFGGDGLEMSFGFRIELDIQDRLRLTTELKPLTKPRKDKGWQGFGKGGLKLQIEDRTAEAQNGTPAAGFELSGDGTLEVVAGNPKVTETADKTSYAFDDLVAEVTQTEDGLSLTTNGEVPVSLNQSAEGLELAVGDATTTRVVDRITPTEVSSQLTNRLDGVDVDHRLIFDVNLLNYQDRAPQRRAGVNQRRIQRMINHGTLNFINPR